MKDFLELAGQRYSERYFDANRDIEKDKLDKILEAGRIAPTAANFQPQKIYVLKSTEALEKAAALTHTFQAAAVLLVCYDIDTVWKNPGDRMFKEYNAGEQDASIVAASMMFEAEDLGVHSIWIRGFDAQSVADEFDLPENIKPVMMLALGYPGTDSKPAPMHTTRKALSETVEEL